MKTKVRILTPLLIVMLVVIAMFPLGASADTPTHGNLVIHKYVMDDVTLAGAPGDGTTGSAIPASATPLGGVQFRIYKVDIVGGKYPAPGEYELNNYLNPTIITDSAMNVFTVSPATPATVTTASPSGIGTASNLPQGIYLVVETANPDVTSPAPPFVVAVPMADPAGTGWLTDVHVYPKNEMLTFEKEVVADSVSVGDPVVYTLVPAVPSDIGKAKKYDITDQLDAALDFVSVSSVRAGMTKAGAATGVILVAGTDYTVTPATATAGGPLVTISFTAAGRAKLATGDGTTNYKYIHIILNTTVNAAILAGDGTVGNTAEIDFTNQFNENKKIKSRNKGGNERTEIHTGRIEIKKVDGAATGTALAGAVFKIATDAAGTQFLKKDASGKILTPGAVGYAAAPDWVVTTAAVTGLAEFAGIADYTSAAGVKTFKTYYLVEVKSPTGYNMIPDPIAVTFDNTAVKANSYKMNVMVENYKGFTLPKTGGTGTLLFTIGGIALVGLALLGLILTKRRRRESESKA